MMVGVGKLWIAQAHAIFKEAHLRALFPICEGLRDAQNLHGQKYHILCKIKC